MVSSKGAHIDAVALQHDPIVFQVLADLEDGRILQERLERARARRRTGSGPARGRRRRDRDIAAVLQRHVAGLARRPAPARSRRDRRGWRRERWSPYRPRQSPARAPRAIHSLGARGSSRSRRSPCRRRWRRPRWRACRRAAEGVPRPSRRRRRRSGRSRPAKGSTLARGRHRPCRRAGQRQRAPPCRTHLIASPPGSRRGSGSIAVGSAS